MIEQRCLYKYSDGSFCYSAAGNPCPTHSHISFKDSLQKNLDLAEELIRTKEELRHAQRVIEAVRVRVKRGEWSAIDAVMDVYDKVVAGGEK